MAGKISQYPSSITTLASGDLFDVSEFLNPGYESKKLDWDDLLTNLNSQITFENIYTTDGTTTGQRTISIGTNDLIFGSSGDVNLLRFDATSDRLGIGIAAPTEKLEVVGNVLISGTKTLKIIDRAEVTNYTAGGIQINGGAGTTNLVHFTDTGSNKMWVGMTKGGVFLNVAGSDDMAIRNSVGDIHFGDGTSRMTLDTSSGNLGIGTLTPSQKLDVVGNINVNDFYIDNVKHIELGGVAGTTQPFIRFFTTANAFNAVVGTNQGVSYGLGDGLNDLAIRNDLGKIFFGANGAGNNMVFNPSSGGLGIGTATPTNKLEVIGNTDSTTYSVNGTAGANFSGVVTSITVVDGIVTAVS